MELKRVFVETPRLLLRPLVSEDSCALSVLGDDLRVADTVSSIPFPFPDNAARDWIDRGINAEHTVALAVLVKEDDLLVGSINVTLEPDHKQAELGFWFGVAYWRRGYATANWHSIAYTRTICCATLPRARCCARSACNQRAYNDCASIKTEPLKTWLFTRYCATNLQVIRQLQTRRR